MSRLPIVICSDGSTICRQKVSHFFKFDKNGAAYCVWCHKTFDDSLVENYWANDPLNSIDLENNVIEVSRS
ncbi:MAG: hypothetical protein ACXAC7_10470 [Candidatus Hodarchaeales archaeon]|jgi:hypothetical protein